MTPRCCLSRPIRALLLTATLAIAAAAQRQPWTTSHIHGSPEPPKPFRVERVYTNITFVNPLDAGTLPGMHRLVVVEQHGKIWTIENENAKQPDLFADLRE